MKNYCNKHYTMYEQATGCLDCSSSNTPQKDAFFCKGLNIVLGDRRQGKTTFCYAAAYHALVGRSTLGCYPLGFQGDVVIIANKDFHAKNMSTFGLPSAWKYRNFFYESLPCASLSFYKYSPKFVVVDTYKELSASEIESLTTFGLKYDVAIVVTHDEEPGAILPYPKFSNIIHIRRINDNWHIQRTYKRKQTDLELKVDYAWGMFTIS